MKVFYVFSILSLLILASCSASVDTPKFDPVKKTEVDTPKLQEFQISSNDQEMVNKIVMNNPQKMSETFEFMFAPQAMTAAELSSYTYDTTGCFPDEYQIYMKWVRLNPSDNEVLSEEVVNYGMKIQAEPAYAYKLSVNIVGADRCSKFYFKFIFRGTS